MNKMSKITHKYNVILPTRGGSNMRSCTKGIFIFNLFYINLDPPQNNVSHHLLAPLISSSLFFFFFFKFHGPLLKEGAGGVGLETTLFISMKKIFPIFFTIAFGHFYGCDYCPFKQISQSFS